MKNTTLVYIENDGAYLMLCRNKKIDDPNANKWIGVGGKQEENETPEECMLREVYEETGIKLAPGSYKLRGMVTFVSDTWESELMFLYTAKFDSRQVSDCNEGDLQWIPIDEIMDLPMWEGDRIFLEKLLAGEDNIMLKLVYKGEELVYPIPNKSTMHMATQHV